METRSRTFSVAPDSRPSSAGRRALGEHLRQAGVVRDADLKEALAEHHRSGERLGAVLMRMQLATDRQVAKAIADQLGLAYVDLSVQPPAPEAVFRLSKALSLKHTLVAIAAEQNALTVAMSDPLQYSVVQDLEFQTGHRVTRVVATREDILASIQESYPETALVRVETSGPISSSPSPREAVRGAAPGSTPVTEIVDLLIESAVRNGASDVHVEPTASGTVVRQRLDGLLKEVMDLPTWVHEGLVSRIKIMAELDISEKRAPQDGRIRTTVGERGCDFRVSTLRTVHGEKVVLRVLDHRKGVPSLDALGLSSAALEQLRRLLRRRHGIILVVGPTGSGKTTTLSAALTSIRSERTNIVTIEDPVEYQIAGVNQTQVNNRIDLSFANSLRAILRQDPDVILVGEIRDRETAQIAIQAAQTGHLVLSTLHTNDAPSCVERLKDIGIEPYATASALVGVVAQRLLRRMCTHCRSPFTPDPESRRAMGLTESEAATSTLFHAAGCEHCHNTGYRGRIGIYEVMPVTDGVRRLIVQQDAGAQLRAAAVAAGMQSLAEDGMLKVKAGLTTFEELLRVVTEVRADTGVCGECGESVEADFVACPACGHAVNDGCGRCGRLLRAGWIYFPYFCEAVNGLPSEQPVPQLRAVR
jgi:type IV pilus assembly protein PilB